MSMRTQMNAADTEHIKQRSYKSLQAADKVSAAFFIKRKYVKIKKCWRNNILEE